MQSIIFPQAKVFQPFGLGVKDGEIFLYTGTSFRKERICYYDTFAPFDFDIVEYLEDLDMIILKSSKMNFSIRISYVDYESITQDFWNSLDDNILLTRNSKICKSGKILERLQPFTAYIELYTENINSELFQFISSDQPCFSDEFLQNFFIVNCLDEKDSLERLCRIQEKESIYTMNSSFCYKFDSLENKDLYFFSYNYLF